MRAIINFFKAIGNFINQSEEYFESRVVTGKFKSDLKYIAEESNEETVKATKTILTKSRESKQYQSSTSFAQMQWKRFMAIQYFAYTVGFIADSLTLFIKYYADFFITFAITFPTVILLLNFFRNNTVLFFISLIPILVFDFYTVSVFYYIVDRREKKEKLSFGNAVRAVAKQFTTINSVYLFQLSLFTLVIISFSILAVFFRFIFDAIAISWSNSFAYWFIVIFIGMIFVIVAIILNIISQQSYFVSLFENKTNEQASKLSLQFVHTYAAPFFLFYLLFYLFCSALIYWTGLYYLYLGIAVSIFFTFNGGLFLGFLLHRRFYSSLTQHEPEYKLNIRQLFGILIFFGFINYTLGSIVLTNQLDSITSSLESQRDSYFLNKTLATYTNPLYKFTLQYPENWSIYEWRGSSITFYNNYTGTLTGGIWMNITIAALDDAKFNTLYNVRPGLVELDTGTKDVTTKISNISVQGNPGLSYTYYKVKDPYPEYQTHYYIKKGFQVYDISFTTLDKDLEANNSDLFERIIGSFRFID